MALQLTLKKTSPSYTVKFTVQNSEGVGIKEAPVYLGREGVSYTDEQGMVEFTVSRSTNSIPYSIEAEGYNKYSGSFDTILEDKDISIAMVESLSVLSVVMKDSELNTYLEESQFSFKLNDRDYSYIYNIDNQEQILKIPNLRYGTLFWTVTKAGYIPKSSKLVVDAPVESLNILLSKTEPNYYDIEFVIRDASNNALQDAEVRLGTLKKITDSSGKVTFEGIQQQYKLEYSISKDGYKTSVSNIDITEDKQVPINLELSNYEVTFKLTELAAETPVKKQAISVTYRKSTTLSETTDTIYTNNSGEITLNNVLEGTISYTINRTGFISVSNTLYVNSTQVESIALVADSVTVYNVTFEVDIKEREGSTVKFPAEGAFVTLGLFGTQYIDSSGIVTFRNIPAGTFEFTIGKFGFKLSTGSVEVNSNETVFQDLILLTQNIRVNTYYSNKEKTLAQTSLDLINTDYTGNITNNTKSAASSSYFKEINGLYWGSLKIVANKLGYDRAVLDVNIGDTKENLSPPDYGGTVPSNYTSDLPRQIFDLYLKPSSSQITSVKFKILETQLRNYGKASFTETLPIKDIKISLEGEGSLLTDKEGIVLFQNVPVDRSLKYTIYFNGYKDEIGTIDTNNVVDNIFTYNYANKINTFKVKVLGSVESSTDFTNYELDDVVVKLSYAGIPTAPLKKLTKGGIVEFKNIPFKLLTITLEKDGYDSESLSYEYTSRQLSPLTLTLVPTSEDTYNVKVKITSSAPEGSLVTMEGKGTKTVQVGADFVLFEGISVNSTVSPSYTIKKEGYQLYRGTVDNSSIVAGSTVTEEVSLTAVNYKLKFYTKDENGAKLPGVSVSVEDEDGNTQSGLTDSGGYIEFLLNIDSDGEKVEYIATKSGRVLFSGSTILSPIIDNQNIKTE